MEQAKAPLSARVVRQIIRGIDACLRRRFGIVEFERGPDAVVLIAVGRAERQIALGDGTRLGPDDRVLELHFWNEHLLALPRAGATLGWAAVTRRQVARSLRSLAQYLQTAPDLHDVQALRIRPAFASRNLIRNLSWIVSRHGFETAAGERQPAADSGAHRGLDSLWVWLLTWTYNPRSLGGRRRFWRTRQEFWISRASFIAIYGQPRRSVRERAPVDRRSIGVQQRAG